MKREPKRVGYESGVFRKLQLNAMYIVAFISTKFTIQGTFHFYDSPRLEFEFFINKNITFRCFYFEYFI